MSFIEISKETRYGYDSLLEAWEALGDQVQRVGEYSLERIRSISSWRDLVEKTGFIFQRAGSRIEGIDWQDVEVPFAEKTLLKNKELHQDLQLFGETWKRTFPGIEIPTFRMVETLEHPLMAVGDEILIRREVAENWASYAAMRRKGVRIGWFPANTKDSVATLFHEAAHVLIGRLHRDDIREILLAIKKKYKSWPVPSKGLESADFKFIERWFREPRNIEVLASRVSGYSQSSLDEMLAEAFSEYMTSPNPRRVAASVGDALLEIFTEIIGNT